MIIRKHHFYRNSLLKDLFETALNQLWTEITQKVKLEWNPVLQTSYLVYTTLAFAWWLRFCTYFLQCIYDKSFRLSEKNMKQKKPRHFIVCTSTSFVYHSFYKYFEIVHHAFMNVTGRWCRMTGKAHQQKQVLCSARVIIYFLCILLIGSLYDLDTHTHFER